MPIIVPIEDNKVGLATATDAKFRAPDYSGSGLEALGAGAVQLGAGIEERRRRAAEAIAAAMLDDRHQGNIDDAAVKKAYVDYSDGSHEALHGDDGLLEQQGAVAHAAFPGVLEKLADNHDEALSKLDDVQRAVLAPTMNERLRSDVERAAEHVRQQGAAEQKGQSEQLQKAAARDAVNHADDPDLFDHHLATGEKAIRQQAKVDNVGDDLLAKQIADYKSGVHTDTIEMLARRDPAQAAAWYDRHSNDLAQRDTQRAEAALDPTPRGASVDENVAADKPPYPADVPTAPFGDRTAFPLMDGAAAATDASTEIARGSTDIDPNDSGNDNNGNAGLRALMRRFPGGGRLLDAAAKVEVSRVQRRPDLARRWNALPPAQRLQDPELKNAARAVNAAQALLYNNDPDLMENLGVGTQIIGDGAKSVIMRYINEDIIPRALEGGTIFNPYTEEELRAGGTKAGLLYKALHEAYDRALNHRQRVALRYFLSHGWNKEQAAAIVGNLTAESGVDPGRKQENAGPGYGLAQWERGKSRAIMFEQVEHVPLENSTIEQQLDFINHELLIGRENPMRQAGDTLKLQKGVEDASRSFTTNYERPRHKAQVEDRVDKAKRVYRQFFGQ